MVMTAPIRKPATTRKERLRLSESRAPTISPMGVMAISEPSVNSAMPKMSTAALRAKSNTAGPLSGATVRASASTIKAIGRTDADASLNFARRALSNGNTSRL